MKPDYTPTFFLTVQPDQDGPGFGFQLTAAKTTPDFQVGDTLLMSVACYPTPEEAEQAAHAVAKHLRLITSRPDDYEEPQGTQLMDVAEYDPDFRILIYPKTDPAPEPVVGSETALLDGKPMLSGERVQAPLTVWAVTLIWPLSNNPVGVAAAVAHVCVAETQEEAVAKARAANPEVPEAATYTTHHATISES